MRCQSRNRRPSSTSCFQRATPFPFHQPQPAAHCPSSDSENPSRLGLRKTFLNGLDNSTAKVLLGFSWQRASILFSHARNTITLFCDCHLYYAPISMSRFPERYMPDDSYPSPTVKPHRESARRKLFGFSKN